MRRHGDVGPQLAEGVLPLADVHPPRHLGVVAVLGLARDLHPLAAGLLAEGPWRRDHAGSGDGCLGRVGRRARRQGS